MPKSSTDTETTSETLAPSQPLQLDKVFSPNSLEAIMAEYGITQMDVTIPKPPTTLKQNFEQLCTEKSNIVDEHGSIFARINGHTGPIMFLNKEREVTPEKSKFEGYDGFYVYALFHPTKGKTVVTIGRPIGEEKPAIVRYLDTLRKGQLFQVASVATSSGYKVFQPVPVQENGKLLELPA